MTTPPAGPGGSDSAGGGLPAESSMRRTQHVTEGAGSPEEASEGEARQRKRVARYFDQAADGYLARYRDDALGAYGFQLRRERVLDSIRDTDGRILDVGCGPGVFAPDILRRGRRYWGLDVSRRMVRLCHGRFPRGGSARFLVGTASALPFPSEHFDAVLCIGVIDRIPRPDRAVREMYRVLKPGGHCLVSFPNAFSLNEAWRHHVYNPIVDRVKDMMGQRDTSGSLPSLASYVSLYRTSEAEQLFRPHFGEDTTLSYFNPNVLLSPLDMIFPRTARRIAEALNDWSHPLCRLFATGYVIDATKQVRRT